MTDFNAADATTQIMELDKEIIRCLDGLIVIRTSENQDVVDATAELLSMMLISLRAASGVGIELYEENPDKVAEIEQRAEEVIENLIL